MERVYPEGPRYCKLAMSIFNALEVSAAELRLKLFAFLNDEGRAPPLKLGVVGFSALCSKDSHFSKMVTKLYNKSRKYGSHILSMKNMIYVKSHHLVS